MKPDEWVYGMVEKMLPQAVLPGPRCRLLHLLRIHWRCESELQVDRWAPHDARPRAHWDLVCGRSMPAWLLIDDSMQ